MTLAIKKETVEMSPEFNVLVGQFENNTRKSRLITPGMMVVWKIKTPNFTKTQVQDYVSDFMTNYGCLTSFSFACPITGTSYTVVYKPGSFRVTYEDGYYKAQFELERVF